MTKRDPDGGPAFPVQPCGEDGLPMCDAFTGMSLRDWFAGQALAGMMSNGAKASPTKPGKTDADCFAEAAYALADAMLQARK